MQLLTESVALVLLGSGRSYRECLHELSTSSTAAEISAYWAELRLRYSSCGLRPAREFPRNGLRDKVFVSGGGEFRLLGEVASSVLGLWPLASKEIPA